MATPIDNFVSAYRRGEIAPLIANRRVSKDIKRIIMDLADQLSREATAAEIKRLAKQYNNKETRSESNTIQLQA